MTVFTANILQLNTPNKNGRVYSTATIEEAIKNGRGQYYGTLGMPEDNKIVMSQVSHMAFDLRVEDGYMKATIQTLDTPMGEVLSGMLDEAAFRLSGYGKIVGNEVTDFQIVTVAALHKDYAA